MGYIPEHVFISFDSCAFGPASKDEKIATEKLLKLIKKYEVQFSIPQAVSEETERAPKWIREMAQAHIFNYDLFNTPEEQKELLEVQRMLFGPGDNLSKSEINDARNLLCAKKYACTYFVTFDKKHILNKHKEIRLKLGFQVITPSKCLNKMQEYLA